MKVEQAIFGTQASPKSAYLRPSLMRLGDVTNLTATGSGTGPENIAQPGPPRFCTNNKNKKPC